MKFPRRQFLHLAAGAAALPAISRIAGAQAYPARPITIVDTFDTTSAMNISSISECRAEPNATAEQTACFGIEVYCF